MADYLFPTTGQRSEYTPGTAEKMRSLERRQKIAAALIEQGMQPKQVRQAGRFVVAPSMMEQLSGPLTTAIGAFTSAYLDKEREGVQESETAKVAEAMQQYAKSQEDVPEYRGRTVPGTGSPAVAAQPSNLEDIIQGGQLDTAPTQLRKPAAQVADALFASQQPQQLQVPPEFAAYRPGVQGSAAVPGRRETVDEALNRVGGEGTAQGVKEGWIDAGPIVRPDLAAAVSEAKRPDQAARPRTPAELRAADMALLASGAPAAWPMVHLTMQQREADKARAEVIEARKVESLRAYGLELQRIQDKQEAVRRDFDARERDSVAKREESQRRYDEQVRSNQSTEEIKRSMAKTDENARIDKARHEQDRNELLQRELDVKIEQARLKGHDIKAAQAKDVGYAIRMAEAHKEINETEADANLVAIGAYGSLGKMPLGMGDAASWAINQRMSPATQRQMQARRNFVNAVLRPESGATITESEFDNANRQYFPVSGDSPEVVKQKKQGRETSIINMIYRSGPAWKAVAPPGLFPLEGDGTALDRAMGKYGGGN